jgi:hypothetical protein
MIELQKEKNFDLEGRIFLASNPSTPKIPCPK